MTKTVTGDELRALLAGKLPVLINFTASWCGPCKAMAPRVDAVAKELEGTAHVVKVDVDQEMLTAGEFKVRSVPTFVATRGGEELGRQTGAMASNVLKEWFEGAIA